MFDHQRMQKEQESKEVVKVCLSAEELQWKPPTTGGRFACPTPGCSVRTSSQGGLVQHIDKMHPKLMRFRGKATEHQVYQFHCPEKTCVYNPDSERYFNTLENLKAHYASQHWEKRHECSKCGKRFGLERDWRRHEAVCGTVFACDSCTAKYPTRQALLMHCKRKQHPVPSSLNKHKSKASEHPHVAKIHDSRSDSTSPIVHSSESSPAESDRQGPDRHSSSGKKMATSSPRAILPKPVMPPVLHVFETGANPGTGSFLCTQTSPYKSPVQVQADLKGITPLYQRLAGMEVSSGCQTALPVSSKTLVPQIKRAVTVVNMGTQVSYSSSTGRRHISDMATQVSAPVLRKLDSSQISEMGTQTVCKRFPRGLDVSFLGNSSLQISDRGTQVSTELVNNGTQVTFKSDASTGGIQPISSMNAAAVGVENAATQVSYSMVNAGTQMEPPMASAAVQTTQLRASTATQATVFCVDSGTQLFLASEFMQPHGCTKSGVGNSCVPQDIASQATQTVKNSTSTQGTQIVFTQLVPEGTNTSTTGMQTSVSLLPKRDKQYRTIAQTQTLGDQILRTAMAQADLPVALPQRGRSPKGTSRSPGRKRSVTSSEVQTNTTVPQKRARKRRKTPPSATSGPSSTQSASQQTNITLLDSSSMREMFESSVRFLDEGSVLLDQNPTLTSSAATDEDSSETSVDNSSEFHDLLSSSPPPQNLTSDMSMQVDFEDLFSSCTADLGVQTQDDFFSVCTADFGAQTHNEHFEVSTTDFGVQTAASAFEYLLDDLERNVDYGSSSSDSVYADLDKPDDGVRHIVDFSVVSRESVAGYGMGANSLQTSLSTQMHFTVSTESSLTSVQAPTPQTATVHCGTGADIPVASVSRDTSRNSALVDCSTGMDILLLDTQTQTHQPSTPSPRQNLLSFVDSSTSPRAGVDRSTSPRAAIDRSTSPRAATDRSTSPRVAFTGPQELLWESSAAQTAVDSQSSLCGDFEFDAHGSFKSGVTLSSNSEVYSQQSRSRWLTPPSSAFAQAAAETGSLIFSSQTQTSAGQNPTEQSDDTSVQSIHSDMAFSDSSTPSVYLRDNTSSRDWTSRGQIERDSYVNLPHTDTACGEDLHSATDHTKCSQTQHMPADDFSILPSTSFVSESESEGPVKNEKRGTSVFAELDFTSTSATDMHTQTADDLLEFLVANMETQTTEDIFTHNLEFSDIQTQTTDVLLTPPRPSSVDSSQFHLQQPGEISPYSHPSFGLVTAQTQTSGHFLTTDGVDYEYDDLEHFVDMQTQTAFDILDICASPPSTSSQTDPLSPILPSTQMSGGQFGTEGVNNNSCASPPVSCQTDLSSPTPPPSTQQSGGESGAEKVDILQSSPSASSQTNPLSPILSCTQQSRGQCGTERVDVSQSPPPATSSKTNSLSRIPTSIQQSGGQCGAERAGASQSTVPDALSASLSQTHSEAETAFDFSLDSFSLLEH